MDQRQRRRLAIASVALSAASVVICVGVFVWSLAAGEPVSGTLLLASASGLLIFSNTAFVFRRDLRRDS